MSQQAGQQTPEERREAIPLGAPLFEAADITAMLIRAGREEEVMAIMGSPGVSSLRRIAERMGLANEYRVALEEIRLFHRGHEEGPKLAVCSVAEEMGRTATRALRLP